MRGRYVLVVHIDCVRGMCVGGGNVGCARVMFVYIPQLMGHTWQLFSLPLCLFHEIVLSKQNSHRSGKKNTHTHNAIN